MTIRNLNHLFKPGSVAIIGASERAHSVGATVLQNVIRGGFAGAIYPVNPRYRSLGGLKAYEDVASLPTAPELAVICTPAAAVPGLIHELGAKGTRAAIVLSAGLSDKGRSGLPLRDEMLAAARPYTLRILGPNCVGMLVPRIGLNASFAHVDALPGRIAFVSQSGAMVTGMLDWAKARGIGFSKFISLGDSTDVDFGDVLDYLADDPDTDAILLYVEAVTHARKFMSGARSAARVKPTLVVKAGRVPEGARAAASHTGALAGSDAVYDAAIRRAGMLRVNTTEELFDAVETLARLRHLRGDRLAILTNGGGPGVMATDALVSAHGRMAQLSPKTLAELDQVLPANWSRGNPVDIIGDAPAERYVQVLEVLMRDPNVDATLFIHAPTAIVPSAEIAAAVAPFAQQAKGKLLSCWLGSEAVAQARAIFTDAGIATYEMPEQATQGFMQMVEYRRNQALLMQVPPAMPAGEVEDRERARKAIHTVLAEGRDILTEPEAKQVLSAYGIPIVETRTAATPEQAAKAAIEIGFPVAIKILSPQISHKTDVGGVALNLEDAAEVMHAATDMAARVAALRPDATVEGFSVQSMASRPEGRELIIGMTTDAVFGPVIMFGQGGVAVEVISDAAVALPPLNMTLARDLVSRTRVSRLLGAYRNREAADQDAICRALIHVADLVMDIPEIVELDINPMVSDARGVIALDGRIKVRAAVTEGHDRLAIRPYPHELEERTNWNGEDLLLRPIRPEDAPQYLDLFHALNPDDVRMRFFASMKELQPKQLAGLTQIDYDREMAFCAIRELGNGSQEILGVARAVADLDAIRAEFAIAVRSDLKHKGLGNVLMDKLVRYCKERGMAEMVGETLFGNTALVGLAQQFGFTVRGGGQDVLALHLSLATGGTTIEAEVPA
jgi:acetyltransferase